MTTQAERRSKMRERLIEATLDILLDSGYHRTTTTEIVKRAGVSRGALVHHFACKADLIAAAADKMLDDATLEIEDLAARLAKMDITSRILWTIYGSSFPDACFISPLNT